VIVMNSLTFFNSGRLLKLLGAFALSSAAFPYLLRFARWVSGFVLGPYRSAITNPLVRAIQRALINLTRRDISVPWFPLNHIVPVQPRQSDNGHPVSGGTRDQARELITSAVRSFGADKYEVSAAARSVEGDDLPRLHQHYAAADLHASLDNRAPNQKQIIVGIDVDYYIEDIEELLAEGLPAIFYTFNPQSVAGADGDCRYRIRENNVHYEVSGGGNWVHQVWDWCAAGEFLEVRAKARTWTDWLLGCLGLRRLVYLKVHHARPWVACPDRVLVWVLPAFETWSLGWAGTEVHARRLDRHRYSSNVRPGWNSVVYVDVDGELKINIGREGEDVSMTLPKAHFDVLMGMSTAQSVTAKMIGMGYKDPMITALFGQFHAGKTKSNGDMSPRLGKPSEPQAHWPAALQCDLPQISGRVYSNPVVSDEAMLPMVKRSDALSVSIDDRVTLVHNPKMPGRKIQGYADEFVKLVVPVAGVGVPFEVDEVVDLLDKPSQTLAIKQIWETVDMPPRPLIEAFLKNEPGMKPARIISSFHDIRFLVHFSKYTLKFRDEVFHAEHNSHWFMPGRTPEQLSRAVCEFCAALADVCETDYSNLDGTVPAWMQRNVMNALYLRYFPSSEELRRFCSMLINCPARAKLFGWKYDAGVGVKSGSPTTCDLNTAASAFVEYCAIREAFPELSPEQAFALIGLKFGDDGLSDLALKSKIDKVAKQLGLVVKIEECHADTGVVFLARVFPSPLTTNTSFQDPLRTWRKLHLTMRDPNVPLADAALDRLEGYLVTDRLSPITGPYARAIRSYYIKHGSAEEQRKSRKCANREKPYWLTQGGGAWPQADEDRELMTACAATRVGITVDTITLFESSLSAGGFSPWSLPTIERGAQDDYKETLDIDGGPVVDGEVGPRIKEHVENIRLRFGGAPTGDTGGHHQDSGYVRVARREQTVYGAQGFGRVSGLSLETRPEVTQSNRLAPVETPRGRLPERGGGRGRGVRDRGPTRAQEDRGSTGAAQAASPGCPDPAISARSGRRFEGGRGGGSSRGTGGAACPRGRR